MGSSLGSDSNRLQIGRVEETTFGTTPAISGTTHLELFNVTGETLNFDIDNIRSETIRSDRLTPDLIQVGARNNGGFTSELQFDNVDDFRAGAFHGNYDNFPVLDNERVVDSAITGATATSTFNVVSGGTAFVDQMLIQTSNFANAANNGIFTVASSSGTTIVVDETSLVTEGTGPATARIKAIGFVGASGDITQTTTGLASTTLDFTTLGLAVGQWIKIGGTAAGDKFDTGANDFARITAIAATSLTLDSITGLATDSGTGKTIKVWVGDFVKIGTTQRCWSVEKALLGQSSPEYIVYTGMVPNTYTVNFESGAIVTETWDFLGDDASVSETALDGSPTAATTDVIFNAVSNVGRLAEGGTVVTTPNFVQSASITLTNNLREQTAVGTLGLVGVGSGDADVTGSLTTYFGNGDLLEKFINNTASSFNVRVEKTNKAHVFSVPNLKFETAPVTADGRNQDVTVDLTFRGLLDSTVTNTSYQFDRFEYFES